MHLVLFDVDGTLTETIAVDAECLLRAFAEVCGFTGIDSDWSHYRHATDAGIFREVFQSRVGRFPSVAETARFRDHLVNLFTAAAQQKPFAAVPGAPELLTRLNERNEYRVALATGCWADCARIKLASGGMRYDDYPAGSADDAEDREGIIQIAAYKARLQCGEKLQRMVYVGDGIWDARACHRLGIPIIGIGAGEQRQKLLAAGAADVLPDFSDMDRFLTIVQNQRERKLQLGNTTKLRTSFRRS